jgi:sugar-specific transcriptional regulator TrmB
MENIKETIIKLGLNEKQADVYLACLELGSATVSEIAEKSGVKRTSIYNFLEELVAKGYLAEIKQDDQILLTAEDPKILEQKAKSSLDGVQNIMPELLAMFNRPGNKPKVLFYQGIKGIKKIYEATLKSKEPIYAFSDFEKMMPLMEKWMWKYADRRAENNIEFLSIAKDGPWARKAEAKSEAHKRKMKIMKDINFDTEINIYENKVAILSFERPLSGLIVEDVAIAQTLKSIWQMIWNSLK